MSNVTNELIYELMKKVQADLSCLKDGMRDLREDNISIRSQIHLVQGDINALRADNVKIHERLDRIEHRLDLREMSEAGKPFLHQA